MPNAELNRPYPTAPPRGAWRRAGCFLAGGWLACVVLAPSAHAEPEPLSPPQLLAIDLPVALALAATNSPELKAAESDVHVAAAQRARAASEHWPSLRAQAGWTEHRRGQRLYPASSPGDPAVITHHVLGGDVVLSFPLYSGGRVTANVDAAELAEDSARDTSAWAKADLSRAGRSSC